MAYLLRTKDMILQEALQKLQKKTELTATSPGSVLRSMVEVVSDELGKYYKTLDFNMSQSFISTATGKSLDLIGSLYNVARRKLSETSAADASLGVFYFYIDAPNVTNFTIPHGTKVFTNDNIEQGSQFAYLTTDNVVMQAGRTRVYVGVRPVSPNSVFAAGPNTLTINDFDEAAAGLDFEVKCTNPKPMPSIVGYETDADYRLRITKEVRRAAGGTQQAIRFAGLSITGVRDITIRNNPYGLGTVEVIVVPEENSLAQGLMPTVISAVNKVRPAGIRLFAKPPEYKFVEVTMQLVFLKRFSQTSDINKVGNVTRRAEIGVLRYINSLLVGDTLIYNQLVESVMESSEFIADVNFTTLSIDGIQILRRNYTPPTDTQLIPGTVRALASN